MSASGAAVLGGAWSIVVLWAGWVRRPAPPRVAALVAGRAPTSRRWSVVERIGRTARGTVSGRHEAAPDRRVDRLAGLAALAVGSLVIASPVAAVGVAGAAVVAGRSAVRSRRRRSAEALIASVPDVIDLLVLVAGTGRPVRSAVALVSVRAHGPLADGLREAVRRIELGERLADALHGLVDELGDPVRPLVSTLVAAERSGVPLVPALEQLAFDTRLERRRRAEEAARRVPVKLLFPLVLCTLPAFALLTVVPLLVGSLASLEL